MMRSICKHRKLKIGVNDMNNVEMMRESNKNSIKKIYSKIKIIALFAVCLFNKNDKKSFCFKLETEIKSIERLKLSRQEMSII